MKRYILLVFCIVLGIIFLYMPLAYVEAFGSGQGLDFEYYIIYSNAAGDDVTSVALTISFFSYFLIFAALLLRWIRIAKWLSALALISPVVLLFYLDFISGVDYTGTFVYVLLSVVFFILCLTLKPNRRPDKKTAGAAEYNRNEDIARNKGISVCAYLGILVLIPLFGGRDSRFARFHANQGLVLLIGLVAVYVLKWILWKGLWVWLMEDSSEPGVPWIWVVFNKFEILVTLFFIFLAAFGITNVLRGREERLPLIGKIRLLK